MVYRYYRYIPVSSVPYKHSFTLHCKLQRSVKERLPKSYFQGLTLGVPLWKKLCLETNLCLPSSGCMKLDHCCFLSSFFLWLSFHYDALKLAFQPRLQWQGQADHADTHECQRSGCQCATVWTQLCHGPCCLHPQSRCRSQRAVWGNDTGTCGLETSLEEHVSCACPCTHTNMHMLTQTPYRIQKNFIIHNKCMKSKFTFGSIKFHTKKDN